MNKKHNLILAVTLIIIIFIIILIYLYHEQKVAVLCYHNISTEEEIKKFPDEETWTINVNNFEEQMKYLYENNYKSLTLDEFYNWKTGKIDIPFKSVLITFDDGFLSNYEYAFPILKKYNINATVFIVGSYIETGTDNWRGVLIDYMSENIIENCKEEYPNIEFASHSYDMHFHNSIDEKNETDINKDIKNFRDNLFDSKYYCYPFGAINEKMIKQLEKNNFNLAFIFGPSSKEYRKASRKDNNYKMPRLNVSYGMDINKFALRLIMPF